MFVAITRLRIRAWWIFIPFAFLSFFVSRQARRSAGNHGLELLADKGRVFWTKSLWTDSASMNAFIFSGRHERVMPKLPGWCDEAAFVNWTQESNELPTWKDAHRRLVIDGTSYEISVPSPRHLTRDFPEPVE
jgi:heme-degrading monooxygenase HmoA